MENQETTWVYNKSQRQQNTIHGKLFNEGRDSVVVKWTPGPWISSGLGFNVLTGDLESSICELKPTGDVETQRATARLIASAPQLYEALESVQWISGNKFDYCPLCFSSTDNGHTKDCIIGQALAKARGEGDS